MRLIDIDPIIERLKNAIYLGKRIGEDTANMEAVLADVEAAPTYNDDLISRQAAIDAITKYCLKYDLRELLADIECLPTAEKKGEWIPTAERLPDKDGTFLVTEQAWNVKTRWVRIASYAQNLQKTDPLDFKGKRHAGWFDYDSEYGHYELSDIIAWMPLKEPYKEESDGEI